MFQIVWSSWPLKIVFVTVELVSVFVVHLWKIQRIWNECNCNKPVNEKCFLLWFFCKRQFQISLIIYCWTHYSLRHYISWSIWSVLSKNSNTLYFSWFTDLIQSLISCNVFPLFHIHGTILLKTALKANFFLLSIMLFDMFQLTFTQK